MYYSWRRVLPSIRTEKGRIPFGEGIAGQSAQSGRQIHLENVPESQVLVDFSGGSIKPASILAMPVFHERSRLKGVGEIASLEAYTPVKLDFFGWPVLISAWPSHSARDHQRLQELLAKTRRNRKNYGTSVYRTGNINAGTGGTGRTFTNK